MTLNITTNQVLVLKKAIAFRVNHLKNCPTKLSHYEDEISELNKLLIDLEG